MYSNLPMHALLPCEGVIESFSISFQVDLAHCDVFIKVFTFCKNHFHRSGIWKAQAHTDTDQCSEGMIDMTM